MENAGEKTPMIVRPRRKWNKPAMAMVTILIVASMVLAAVLLPTSQTPVHVSVVAGNYFRYGLTGSSNATTFDDSMNFTVRQADGNVFEWMGSAGPYHGQVSTGDFGPFSTSNAHPWEWAGNEMISTPFGDKCVKVLWYYDIVKDQLFVLNEGIDSSFPYREVMTNATSSDHYSVALSGSNNSDLAHADAFMRSADIKGNAQLTERQGIPQMWGGFSDNSGVSLWGSIEAKEGQHFFYNASGNKTMVWVFKLSDFQNVEKTGTFSYNVSLSKPAGDFRVVNATVETGTYWFFAALRGQEGAFFNNLGLIKENGNTNPY
jgi:hypothetical protein